MFGKWKKKALELEDKLTTRMEQSTKDRLKDLYDKEYELCVLKDKLEKALAKAAENEAAKNGECVPGDHCIGCVNQIVFTNDEQIPIKDRVGCILKVQCPKFVSENNKVGE